ncbi:MAG: tryptophan synthase subunit alpha [Lachnospiraceae bacterium]|nr:tryptophan synthase subunit alpha [Lachnospiraceae bacterium]
MSRISDAFKEKAFIPFVTGGDPDLATTKQILIEMEKAGADIIEVGIPFSDPIAEGPVIQEANERALSAGCTTDKLFDMIKEARETVKVPILFMTYANAVFKYGSERFMERCVDCGIDGLIVPDVPYEEKQEFDGICAAHGIDYISMIAPTSHDRIRMIAKDAKGFVYCVSSMGVTGVRSEITTDVGSMVKLVKEVTDTPVAIGFGISTPEQAAAMAAKSDGAIVGSAIVKLVAKYGKDAPGYVGEYVKSMKDAVRNV